MQELVSLREERMSSHAHKKGSWYPLRVLLKICDGQRRPFYMGAPPPAPLGVHVAIFTNFAKLQMFIDKADCHAIHICQIV